MFFLSTITIDKNTDNVNLLESVNKTSELDGTHFFLIENIVT